MNEATKVVKSTSLPKSESTVSPPQSAAASTTGAIAAAVSEVGTRVGNFRWVICALHFFAASFGAILFGLGAKFNQSVVLGRADRQFAAALPGASAALAAVLIGATVQAHFTQNSDLIRIMVWIIATCHQLRSRENSSLVAPPDAKLRHGRECAISELRWRCSSSGDRSRRRAGSPR